MESRTFDPEKMAKRIETWPVSRLKPYEKNARTHSEAQVDKLAASLVEFGFTNPILVDSEDGIIAGHGRLLAAKKLGLGEVPVIVLDHLTDEQRRAYILADNRLAEDAGWDERLLADELRALRDDGFDLGPIGFTDDELADLLTPEEQENEGSGAEDEVPEDVEPIARRGDLFILGKHRLLCGDSTNAQHVERLIAGAKIDTVFTDPPYGIAFKAMRKNFSAIANDGTAAEAQNVVRDALALFRGTKTAFVCCDWRSLPTILDGMSHAGFEPKACIVWDKQRGVQNLDRYYKQHELIVYAGPYGGQKTQCGDVWQCARDFDPDHPTPKPVELIVKALVTSGEAGDRVVDTFGGSGSTMIACEKTGRECFTMELEPKYCDVIVQRWQNFTGRQASLEDGTLYDDLKTERAG